MPRQLIHNRASLRHRSRSIDLIRRSEQVFISSAVLADLRGIARAHQSTLFTVMFAVFIGLLVNITGETDVAVGSMFANRARPQTQGTVGFVANLIVLRVKVPARPTFDDVIRAAHDTVAGALVHQDLPYHLLPQSSAAQPVRVDDVVFQMLAEPIDQVARAGDLELEGVVPDVVGRFDVEFALMASEDGCAVKLYFTEDRLDPGWAHGFVTAYVALAESVATAPGMPLGALDLM